MGSKPKLGEILLRAGVIEPDQLRSALGQQKNWGKRLGSTLIAMGALAEKDLVRALASQLSIPVVQLEGKRIDAEVLELLSLELADKHGCLPLFIKEEGGVRTLFLGMENPCDIEAIDDVSFRAGMHVKPVMVSPSELELALERHYGKPPPPPGGACVGSSGPGPAAAAAPAQSLESREPGESGALLSASPAEILKALTHLLIERGVIPRDDLVACLRAIKEDNQSS